MDGGVARITFGVKFGAVAWISRVTQFAVIPRTNDVLKRLSYSCVRKIGFECGWKRM